MSWSKSTQEKSTHWITPMNRMNEKCLQGYNHFSCISHALVTLTRTSAAYSASDISFERCLLCFCCQVDTCSTNGGWLCACVPLEAERKYFRPLDYFCGLQNLTEIRQTTA